MCHKISLFLVAKDLLAYRKSTKTGKTFYSSVWHTMNDTACRGQARMDTIFVAYTIYNMVIASIDSKTCTSSKYGIGASLRI
jgi:hypothetical protein